MNDRLRVGIGVGVGVRQVCGGAADAGTVEVTFAGRAGLRRHGVPLPGRRCGFGRALSKLPNGACRELGHRGRGAGRVGDRDEFHLAGAFGKFHVRRSQRVAPAGRVLRGWVSGTAHVQGPRDGAFRLPGGDGELVEAVAHLTQPAGGAPRGRPRPLDDLGAVRIGAQKAGGGALTIAGNVQRDRVRGGDEARRVRPLLEPLRQPPGRRDGGRGGAGFGIIRLIAVAGGERGRDRVFVGAVDAVDLTVWVDLERLDALRLRRGRDDGVRLPGLCLDRVGTQPPYRPWVGFRPAGLIRGGTHGLSDLAFTGPPSTAILAG